MFSCCNTAELFSTQRRVFLHWRYTFPTSFCLYRPSQKKRKLFLNSTFHLSTDLFFGEDKAWNVGHVEEKIAHNVSRLGPGHLEAGAEPLITVAVHHSVEPHVGQAVLCLAGLDAEGTAEVVLPAAPVRP